MVALDRSRSASPEAGKAFRKPTSCTMKVQERARACVMARLADRTLTPRSLAADVGISRSSLYRLLAHPTGINGFIREIRLESAHGALEAAMPYKGIVTDIWKAHGFPNHLVFWRAFQGQFGICPSAVVHLQMARARTDESLSVVESQTLTQAVP